MRGPAQAKGLLREGQVLGNAALPPFERWTMTAPRYLQYLANLLHVHSALERAAAAALAAGQQHHSGGRPPACLACRRPAAHSSLL